MTSTRAVDKPPSTKPAKPPKVKPQPVNDGADAAAFAAEAKGEGPTLEWRGLSFTLPPTIPAIVVFETMRLQRVMDANADVPIDRVERMMIDLYGEELLFTILRETRTTMEELPDMMKATMAAYNPPNREARRAAGRARST